MKRILTILMSAIMVLSMMPAMAFAEEEYTKTGYGGKELPAAPQISGDVITVNPNNVQYTLDGAYGSIDGKTIVLSAGEYDKLELGRATKYPGSGTEYYIGGISEENRQSFDKFYEIKTSGTWSASAYYVRNMSNVTIKAEDGAEVSIAGMIASSGHAYGDVYDYVLDKDYDSGSAYYLTLKLNNIKFDGLKFTAKVDISSSLEETEIDGVSFNNCRFNIDNTAAGNQALRYYNENNNEKVRNLTVDNCEFNTCYQGVYTQKVNGIKVVNSKFDTTSHNAIAVQSGSEVVNHKSVVIKGNTFAGIGDRIIRFGDVGADTQITIQGNKATNSGDSAGQVIKAQSLAEGIKYSISENDWGEGTSVANSEFKDQAIVATVGYDGYTNLADAVTAANQSKSDVTITLLEDVSITSDLGVGNSNRIDFNLNGKTIDGGSSAQVYTKGDGTVIFTGDGTIKNNKSTNNAGSAALYVYSGSKAVVNNATIIGNYMAIANYGDLNILKADISATCFGIGTFGSGRTILGEKKANNSGIKVNAGYQAIATAAAYSGSTSEVTVYGGEYSTSGKSWDDCPIYWAGHGTLNVYDGEFKNKTSGTEAAGIYQKNGIVNIYGGTFDGTGERTKGDGIKLGAEQGDCTEITLNVYDGYFTGKRSGLYYKTTSGGSNCTKFNINVKGGTFVGESTAVYTSNGNLNIPMSILVDGGRYSSDVSTLLKESTFCTLESDKEDALYLVHKHNTQCNLGHTYCPATCEGENICHTASHYIAPVTPSEPDNVTNSGSAGTDNAQTNADMSDKITVSDGAASIVVDKDTADRIVDKAVANESKEVVIQAETAKGDSTGSTVALPESTVQALAKKTEASVTIKTDSATVTLDKAAVDATAAQAGTDGEVKLVVETVENTEDTLKLELKLVTSKGTVTDFKDGNVTVTVPVDEKLAEGKTLVCVYIDDNGKYTKMEGSLASDGKTYTFTTGHFSTYAIMDEAEADAIIAKQNIKVGTASVKLYTSKGGKLRVKASAKNATGYRVYYKKSSWKNYKTYTKGKIKTLDKTFKKLSKGKYTVKVKAYYKDYDGTKAVTWGSTSKAKSIRVK